MHRLQHQIAVDRSTDLEAARRFAIDCDQRSSGAAVGVAAFGAPNTLSRLPRGDVAVATGTVYDGAVGDDDHRRSNQKTALAATAAQITNANRRAFIGPL